MSGKKLHIGTFDSEKYWDRPDSAGLPFLPDKNAGDIVLAMDELLFSFCREEDLLITRLGFDEALYSYLKELGYRFSVNKKNLVDSFEQYRARGSHSTTRLFLEAADPLEGGDRRAAGYNFDAYSILPEDERIRERYDVHYDHPGIEAVKKVNSKLYSNELIDELGLKNYGRRVYSAAELDSLIDEPGTGKTFLLKEEFGVSGRGNQLLNSPKTAGRIVKYIKKQEEKGKSVRLLLEDFLNKETDFGAHFKLEKDGSYRIIGVQLMLNNNFGYQGSVEADEHFMARLEKLGYFKVIEQIAAALHRQGYWGTVCVDSMLLAGGELVPIVEINARKSMGLVHYSLNEFINRHNNNGRRLSGRLTFLSVGFESDLQFEDIYGQLKERGLLFLPGRPGIFPVSANTLFAIRNLKEAAGEGEGSKRGLHKGRFYFSAVAAAAREQESLIGKLRLFFEQLEWKIYN